MNFFFDNEILKNYDGVVGVCLKNPLALKTGKGELLNLLKFFELKLFFLQ
jgi:hypothetical protein